MRKNYGRERGLTLIEVMAVLAVSGLLLTGMWKFYHSGIRAYRRGFQDVRSTLSARTVLRIMTRDIQKAFIAAAPHGIQGTNHQPSPSIDADRLTLTMAASSSATLQSIRYIPESVSQHGMWTLNRAVMASDRHPSERIMMLSQRLYSLDLRYFDGQTWHDSWQHPAVPQALEISLIFQPRGRNTHAYHFTTTVARD